MFWLSRRTSTLLITVMLLVTVTVLAPGARAAPTGSTGAGTVLRLPLAGAAVVVTPFTAPVGPFGAGHRGVDLAGSVGQMVVAPADGVVSYAGRVVDRGVVSIDGPSGVRSSFEPVTASVSAGQPVRAGDVIGTLDAGHPRCAALVVPSSCLHWGVRVNGDYVDPMLLLAPLRVRLLPWDE